MATCIPCVLVLTNLLVLLAPVFGRASTLASNARGDSMTSSHLAPTTKIEVPLLNSHPHVAHLGAPAPAPLSRKSGAARAAAERAQAGEAAPTFHIIERSAKAEGGSTPSNNKAFAEDMDAVTSQWWAGRRVMQPAQVEKAVRAGTVPEGPVLSATDLKGLNDEQLYQVFTNGVADTPSAQPGEMGNWTFCVGQALSSNESWVGGIPKGAQSAVNNFADGVWRGNAFYTNPATKNTQAVNMIFSNSTVAWLSFDVTNREVGLSPDKKPSVVISYNNSELYATRFIDEELRRVGPNVWLARAWVVDPATRLFPTQPYPFMGPWVDAAKLLSSETYKYATKAVNWKGPNNQSPAAAPGDPWSAFWFSLECTYDAAPQLFYLPVSVGTTVGNSWTGYFPYFSTLPALNAVAGKAAVENWMAEYPAALDVPRNSSFVLWPWLAPPNGPSGFLRIPTNPITMAQTSDSEAAPGPAQSSTTAGLASQQKALSPAGGSLGRMADGLVPMAATLAPMADMMPSPLRSAAHLGANLTREWAQAYADVLKGVTSMWLAN